jgi:hypothetical protein
LCVVKVVEKKNIKDVYIGGMDYNIAEGVFMKYGVKKVIMYGGLNLMIMSSHCIQMAKTTHNNTYKVLHNKKYENP